MFIDYVAVFINGATDQFLGVTFHEYADFVTVLVLDKASFDHKKTFESSEWRFTIFIFLGQCLRSADDMTFAVPELTFGVALNTGTSNLLGVSFNEFTNGSTVSVTNFSVLVAF